ncbi:hypothetical protein [Sphingobacterium sp. UBA2074]|uniref:hypothetical protein n=1 Tax=Sphingobacterium sp. UBA2074 TaxID=1947487 RepID=UPI00257CA1C8|nr:hypothetical protein [Sphingobacterium sp. UBA2074]
MYNPNMNDLSVIKQHLLSHFIYLLKDTGITRLHDEEKLANVLQIHYLSPGQRIEQPAPQLFILIHGLLKEYERSSRKREPSSFVQLLMPDTIWLYNQSAYHFRTRALMPSWLLSLEPSYLHYILNHPQKLKLWLEEHELCYRSKHYLSEFLKTHSSSEDRIHLFLEEYGPYVDFLSDNEISLYTGINSKAVQKLREIAFLYQRFD